jgi:hypothetical protein
MSTLSFRNGQETSMIPSESCSYLLLFFFEKLAGALPFNKESKKVDRASKTRVNSPWGVGKGYALFKTLMLSALWI